MKKAAIFERDGRYSVAGVRPRPSYITRFFPKKKYDDSDGGKCARPTDNLPLRSLYRRPINKFDQ